MTKPMSVAANLEALLSGELKASDFRRKYKFGIDSVVPNAINAQRRTAKTPLAWPAHSEQEERDDHSGVAR